MQTQYIDAEKLYETPDVFVEIREQQMNDFLHSKEAITTGYGTGKEF